MGATVALATPQEAFLRSAEMETKPDGFYNYSFDIDDGTRVVETGEQKQITAENSGTVSRGQYTFVYEGVRYTVDWTADEMDSLPKEITCLKLLNKINLYQLF